MIIASFHKAEVKKKKVSFFDDKMWLFVYQQIFNQSINHIFIYIAPLKHINACQRASQATDKTKYLKNVKINKKKYITKNE